MRRVVITGCGVVTAAGTELEGFWNALMDGTCFIRPLQHFSYYDMPALLGAEVELAPEDGKGLGSDATTSRARCAQLANAAVERALSDAAMMPVCDPDRTGVIFGSTLGEEREVGDLSERWVRNGPDDFGDEFWVRCDNHRLASRIAGEHGIGGPVQFCAAACSSGNAAVAFAYDLVSSGAADVMIAGGADALTRSIYCGFERMGALSKSICRPFDRRRDGVSFGEGAGVVVLETLEHANRRNAPRIYAEIAGYGMSNDAHHITAPDPNGEGFARAMKQALHSTLAPFDEIDYISPHGTGTLYNDRSECRAIKSVFGDRARHIPVSSVKSMIGHTNGAAGAIETVVCALALTHQAVPPTANLNDPDPECDLDCVPLVGRALPIQACLNLAAGFGGFNVCLVLKRVQ
jgi:3-oxoacyl-[acyl-carrier-protein] synthase II